MPTKEALRIKTINLEVPQNGHNGHSSVTVFDAALPVPAVAVTFGDSVAVADKVDPHAAFRKTLEQDFARPEDGREAKYLFTQEQLLHLYVAHKAGWGIADLKADEAFLQTVDPEEDDQEAREKAREELKAKIGIFGDIESAVVAHHEKFIKKIASRFLNRSHILTIDDLVQAGSIGFVDALRKFEHTRGFQLTTFAGYKVWESIQNAIYGTGRMIRIPDHMEEKISRFMHADEVCETEEQLLEYYAKNYFTIKDALSEINSVREVIASGVMNVDTLDLPIGESKAEPLSILIEDKKVDVANEFIENDAIAEFKKTIILAMYDFTVTEARIMFMYYGIDARTIVNGRAIYVSQLFNREEKRMAADFTLKQMGAKVGLSHARVKQIGDQKIKLIRSRIVDKWGNEKYESFRRDYLGGKFDVVGGFRKGTLERYAKVEALAKDGKDSLEIAEELGLKKAGIENILYKLKIDNSLRDALVAYRLLSEAA